MEETPTSKRHEVSDQPSNELLLHSNTIPLDSSSAAPPIRRGRGRPRGSRNKTYRFAKTTSASVRSSFTSHIIKVNAQENLFEKIMEFSHNLSKSVRIISAIGSASKAIICPISTSDETVTYEGRFEILSLSGSLLVDHKKETVGTLNVMLLSDGRIFGGRVAGVLITATPVQIVLGSITLEGQEEVKSLPKMKFGEDSSNLPSQTVTNDSPKKTPGEGTSNLLSQTAYNDSLKKTSGEGTSNLLSQTTALNESSSDELDILS